jgi:hypothetical protein
MTDEKKQTKAEIVEVPTQMGLAIRLPDGRNVSEAEVLVEIYNQILEIKKAVA